MSLNEFIRKVLANEITDFEPYFKQEKNENKIYAMRKVCIENNVYQEKYREWADELVHLDDDQSTPSDDDVDLQFLLLDANQCLDILICSESKAIRREVVEKDIKYAFEDHVMDYDQDIIIEILMREIEPHTELLDTFLECQDGSWGAHDIGALELKQKARTIVPTLIEKTMSPVQLFDADNPLWTTIFTGYQVRDIIQAPSPKDALLAKLNLLAKINERN